MKNKNRLQTLFVAARIRRFYCHVDASRKEIARLETQAF
jgi:hypothetical protein